MIFSFIVLEHDLYEVTVDLAVGYTLNAALTHNPPFSVSALWWKENIKAEKLTWLAQTNRNLFQYTNRKSVCGKQQERDVPLHEPHGRDELKLEYKQPWHGLEVEPETFKFGEGWNDSERVADWGIDLCLGVLLSFNREPEIAAGQLN